MTKQILIIKLEDIMDELKYGDVEGISELTLENTIYSLESMVTLLKDDEN